MLESSPPSEIFPDRLRDARELRGLNQAELAKRAGLQPSAVSHFETGTRKPSFDNLKRLADALEVTTDYLLGRADESSGVAATDEPFYRHFEELSSDDRDVARDLVARLAERSKQRKPS